DELGIGGYVVGVDHQVVRCRCVRVVRVEPGRYVAVGEKLALDAGSLDLQAAGLRRRGVPRRAAYRDGVGTRLCRAGRAAVQAVRVVAAGDRALEVQHPGDAAGGRHREAQRVLVAFEEAPLDGV